MLWYPKSKEFDYLIRIHILFGKFQNIYFSIHCKQIIDEQKVHTFIKRQKQSFNYWKLTIRRWESHFCPNNTPFKYRYGNQDKWSWSHIWMVFACFWVHSIFFSIISMTDFFLLPVVAWVKVISPSSFPPLKYDDKILFETSNCSEDRHQSC